MGAALPFIKANRLRALPEVPAIGEHLKGFEASTWFAVFAPAGTPRTIITQLHAVLAKCVAMPDVEQQLAEQGYEPLTSTPEELGAYVTNEIAKWAKVIRDANIPKEGS